MIAVFLVAALAGEALAVPGARAGTKPTVVIQPKDVTVRPGDDATFTSYASGSPAPTVQWQKSTDKGKTWKNIVGATKTKLKITGSTSNNGYQYHAVFTNSAGVATSNAATLTVKQTGNAPKVTTQPVSLTVVSNSKATFTATASGTPAPDVQWQQSTDGKNWTYVAGGTKTTLSFTATKALSGHKYRVVFSNTNGQATTKSATLTVSDQSKKPIISTQPLSQTVPAGKKAVFKSTAAGDPAPTVQWQQSKDGVNWKVISGAKSTTYTFTANQALNGFRYRAVFTNSAGTATSAAAKLTVGQSSKKPVVVIQPTKQVVDAGDKAVFTASATGLPAPKVQWQRSANGTTWTNIPGATKTTCTFVATKSRNNNRYRAVFTNSAGKAYTRAAKLTVTSTTKPVVSTQPTPQTVVVGRQATFTSTAAGMPAPTVQWQQSANGSSWSNISGATDTTCSFTATKGKDGYRYRAVFTNSAGSVKSQAAKLEVLQETSKPVVTGQPVSTITVAGSPVTFTATAAGVPDPTVQWQTSADGTTWANIAGATTTTCGFVATSDLNGHRYRAVFTNSAGSATSSAATLTVWSAPVITTQPQNGFGAFGDTIVFTAAASGNPAPSVQWYTSWDDGASWDPVPGATDTTLRVVIAGGLDSKFRAVFTNAVGSATTDTVQIFVF
jgi:hypothetical protein